MNLFLISPNPMESSKELSLADPVRARKQLVESLQILGTTEILVTGKTSLLKKDGTPYKKAHQHHPITRNMLVSPLQWKLCYQLACSLASIYTEHACTKSLNDWVPHPIHPDTDDGTLVVVRTGYEKRYVTNYEDYSYLCRAYCRDHKNMKLP